MRSHTRAVKAVAVQVAYTQTVVTFFKILSIRHVATTCCVLASRTSRWASLVRSSVIRIAATTTSCWSRPWPNKVGAYTLSQIVWAFSIKLLSLSSLSQTSPKSFVRVIAWCCWCLESLLDLNNLTFKILICLFEIVRWSWIDVWTGLDFRPTDRRCICEATLRQIIRSLMLKSTANAFKSFTLSSEHFFEST